MARKDARKSGQPLPLNYHQIPEESRKPLDDAMGELGRGAKDSWLKTNQKKYETAKEKLANPATPPKDRRGFKNTVGTFEGIQEHAVSGQPVTQEGAVGNRQRLVRDAMARARRHGHSIPHGAMWYPQHNEDISRAANQHGWDPNDAITASAVMSPQNSPDNEKASVIAHMDAIKNHSVKVTPALNRGIKKESKGKYNLDEHVGKTVPIKDLTPDQTAYLSHTEVRDEAEKRTNANLRDMGLGGGKGQVADSVNILKGNVHRDEAIDPHRKPKVGTYNHNIQSAQFDSAEVEEYAHRVHHLMNHNPGQDALFDATGHAGSSHGVLNPEISVQDTWMNAVNNAHQPNKIIPGTKSNVAKTVATPSGAYLTRKQYDKPAEGGKTKAVSFVPGNKDVTGNELHHAWGQHMDEQNVKRLTKAQHPEVTGEVDRPYTLGGHFSQATAWTEERIQGGKDEAYNKALKAHQDKMWEDAAPHPGQLDLTHSTGPVHPEGHPMHDQIDTYHDDAQFHPSVRNLNRDQFDAYHKAKYDDAIQAGRTVDDHLYDRTRPVKGYSRHDLYATQAHLDHEAAIREPDIQGQVKEERKAQGKLW